MRFSNRFVLNKAIKASIRTVCFVRRGLIQRVVDPLKSCQMSLLHAVEKLTELDCEVASEHYELDTYS